MIKNILHEVKTVNSNNIVSIGENNYLICLALITFI